MELKLLRNGTSNHLQMFCFFQYTTVLLQPSDIKLQKFLSKSENCTICEKQNKILTSRADISALLLKEAILKNYFSQSKKNK